MSRLFPAASVDAARWLLEGDVDWMTLVRSGPDCFEAYVRIAFETDGGSPRGETDLGDTVQVVLSTLTAFTSTPGECRAAVWEGWIGSDPAPGAPRLLVPHRTMLLFEGPVDVLRDAPALAWSLPTYPGHGTAPHLAWPADRAWCLACEVDEEVEFTVGCSTAAAEALARALPRATRRSAYGAPAPLYRDET